MRSASQHEIDIKQSSRPRRKFVEQFQALFLVCTALSLSFTRIVQRRFRQMSRMNVSGSSNGARVCLSVISLRAGVWSAILRTVLSFTMAHVWIGARPVAACHLALVVSAVVIALCIGGLFPNIGATYLDIPIRACIQLWLAMCFIFCAVLIMLINVFFAFTAMSSIPVFVNGRAVFRQEVPTLFVVD